MAMLVVTAWVGGLWAIGYLAAPALFYYLPDRQLAGMLAGEMFAWIAYAGMASAILLMVQRVWQYGAVALKQLFFWAVLVMLALTLVGHFGFQPILAQLKAK